MFLLQIMQGRGRRNQPESRPDFPWFSFPNVVAPKVLVQWIEKLAWLKERKVHIPAEINWSCTEEVSQSKALEPFLTKSFDRVQGQFICMTWGRLFHIQEPVYKELCVEFLATGHFRKKKGIHDRKIASLFAWA